MLGDAHLLGVFLTDFADLTLTIGAVTSPGILDLDTVQVLSGESTTVNLRDLSVLVKTGIFPTMALKAVVTLTVRAGRTVPLDVVGGWRVADFGHEPPDGALTRIKLQRV